MANKKGVATKATQPKRPIKKKKNTKLKKLLKWISLIILIIGALAFLCTTPIFNVTDIDVIGNSQITSEEIISLSGITFDENTFRNRKSCIIKNVKENPYVKSVSVKRILPSKIQINVEERTVKFMIPLLNSYAYIDSQGYILEISEVAKEVPILKGMTTSEENLVAGNRLNTEDLEKLENILKLVSVSNENQIDSYITEINVEDEENYNITMASEGKIAYLGDLSNLNTRILYIKAIMEAEEGNEGEIFVNGDLNNGFQPYFREKI
jgi:cell division protein FtsQ